MFQSLRSGSLAGLGLALAVSVSPWSPTAAQETQPTAPAEAAPAQAAPAQAAPAAPAPLPAPETVVATVDGQPITQADLTRAESDLDPQFSQLPPEQRRAAALSAVIEIRLMAARARAEGFDKDAEFQRRMAFLEARALHAEVVEKDVAAKLTEADVRARYDKEMADTPPVNEVRARHILVKTKEEAEAIIKELDAGGNFEEIAKAKSSDPGSGAQGGDLGYFGPGQMVPSFEQAALALEVGTYTKVPVQSDFGWHVIKVEDKRVKQPPAFEQVKEQVRSLLLRERYFELVNQVRAAAKVDITDPQLKEASDAAAKQ